jgi:DNA polymerase III subunit delta'
MSALHLIGKDGRLPLPWLEAPFQKILRTPPKSALLIHGPKESGQFELAYGLAQSWLCEQQQPGAACGQCHACHLTQLQSHLDLCVLLPEALQVQLGVGPFVEEHATKTAKTKPSLEIKAEAVRAAIEFTQTTASRQGLKVVLIHPAEQLNLIAAHTLLKTLEEPPSKVRFILSAANLDALLPTLRSRCQLVAMKPVPTPVAVQWLAAHNMAQPEVLLAAVGGQPLQALQWAQQGVDAALWLALPEKIASGDIDSLKDWPLARLIDMLQKWCHDEWCVLQGGLPRYFPSRSLLKVQNAMALAAWSKALQTLKPHDQHPFNGPLMLQTLVQQAQTACCSVGGKSIN